MVASTAATGTFRPCSRAQAMVVVSLAVGIAARGFVRTFILADGMKVEGAILAHGLLHIDLARPEPERLVQRIPIKTAG